MLILVEGNWCNNVPMHGTISSDAQQNDVNTHMALPGTHRSARTHPFEVLMPTSTDRQLSFACLVCRNFIPNKILSPNIISCNIIYSANGNFKSWAFYRSCPSAGNKQSVHIVSFPSGRTCSCPSAGYTTMRHRSQTSHAVTTCRLSWMLVHA